MEKVKAMILAAGLGTRLKPFTDHHPKALAPVHGKPVLQRNIEYLQQYGIDEVIVNVHHHAEELVATIKDNHGWGSNVTISDETDAVLETGGGILKAKAWLQSSNPFVVMNADVLTDLDLGSMLLEHHQAQPMGTLAVTNRASGRALLFDATPKLCGWQNTKTGESKGAEGSPMAFSGIQILSPAIFDLIPFTGKFSMIDVYLHLCPNFVFQPFDHSSSIFIDIGTPEKLANAEKIFLT